MTRGGGYHGQRPLSPPCLVPAPVSPPSASAAFARDLCSAFSSSLANFLPVARYRTTRRRNIVNAHKMDMASAAGDLNNQ